MERLQGLEEQARHLLGALDSYSGPGSTREFESSVRTILAGIEHARTRADADIDITDQINHLTLELQKLQENCENLVT